MAFPPVSFPLSSTWCFVGLVGLLLNPLWLTHPGIRHGSLPPTVSQSSLPLRVPSRACGRISLGDTHRARVAGPLVSCLPSLGPAPGQVPSRTRTATPLLMPGSSWVSHFCQPSGCWERRCASSLLTPISLMTTEGVGASIHTFVCDILSRFTVLLPRLRPRW